MSDLVGKARGNIDYLTNMMKGLWNYSLVEYLLHAPTNRDAWVYLKSWVGNKANILKFGVELLSKIGPVGIITLVMNNPWFFYLLKSDLLTRRLGRGKTGRYHESICMLGQSLNRGVTELLDIMFLDSSRLLLIEDMLQPDLFQAMGLRPFNMELWGLALPVLVPEAVQAYIDEGDLAGVNPDACSLPRATIGMVRKGHLPKGLALVSSNMPCDAGMASYNYYQRAFDIPMYHLDVPYHFYHERASKLLVEDIKGMIAFLEKHTPGRMDWDKFREMCLKRNRMMELELELWDMVRAKPAPLAGEAIWISHLWHFCFKPGLDSSIAYYENLVALAKENLREHIPATINERYRTLLWNAPFFHYVDIFNRAERTYGMTIMMDSLTYNHHEFIDISTPESMLRGWGNIVMQGPMVRHNRGPSENYMDDLFRAYRQFDSDMVWVANHVGCKSSQSLIGMLREQCRAKGMPLLVLDYDMTDPRIVSHDSMWRQVEHFMDNVMKAKRLD